MSAAMAARSAASFSATRAMCRPSWRSISPRMLDIVPHERLGLLIDPPPELIDYRLLLVAQWPLLLQGLVNPKASPVLPVVLDQSAPAHTTQARYEKRWSSGQGRSHGGAVTDLWA